MDVNSLLTLVQGERYVFRYKLPGQGVLREGMADYLGRGVKNNGTIDLQFSGRPEFGTMTINSEHLQSVYLIPALEKADRCYMDKKVRA